MLIIFDLDDTLLDTSNDITPFVLKNTLKAMISKGLKVDEEFAYKKVLKIDKKSLNSKETIRKFLVAIEADLNFYNIAVEALDDIPIQNIKISTLKNASKVLSYLSKRHTLAIVSMGKEKFQFNKIKKAGIDTSIFSKIVITKQENKGFHYKKLIDEFGFDPESTFVCGDKVNVDLVPAKKLGCSTIHMKWGRGKNFKEEKNVDHTINSLDEIKTIIDEKLR